MVVACDPFSWVALSGSNDASTDSPEVRVWPVIDATPVVESTRAEAMGLLLPALNHTQPSFPVVTCAVMVWLVPAVGVSSVVVVEVSAGLLGVVMVVSPQLPFVAKPSR